MLQKKNIVKGSVVEVLPVIKTGLPAALSGGSSELKHLSVRRDLMLGAGGWGVTSGARLEVIEPPKRRDGINTAIVKIVGTENIGHVYWCELRASCKQIEP